MVELEGRMQEEMTDVLAAAQKDSKLRAGSMLQVRS